MNHDIEIVIARWQRLHADEVFELWFSKFRVGDMLPGTIVYDRLRLAIALQRLVHAFRVRLRRTNPLARLRNHARV